MRQAIQKILDELINPAVASHGGRIELVDVHEMKVYIRMTGGCHGCASSSATLRQGVEATIREEAPYIEAVIDVTDHSAGANPFYSNPT